MGYLSRLRGRISIAPPLRWSEFKDSKYRKYSKADTRVVFEEQDETSETDDGFFERRWAIALIPASEDQLTHYGLEDDLVAFVAELGRGREFIGCLIREGEEQGDVERYSIVDGGVRTEKAELRWPDGSVIQP